MGQQTEERQDQMNPDQKPGYRTSEFWLSLAAVLVGAVMASGLLDGLAPDNAWVRVLGIVASILGALGYQVSRTMTKTATTAAIAAVAASVPANPQTPPQPK